MVIRKSRYLRYWIQVIRKINPVSKSVYINSDLDRILLVLGVNARIGRVRNHNSTKWSRIKLIEIASPTSKLHLSEMTFERQIWADRWRLAFASFCTLKNFDHNHHRKIKTKIDANSRWWRIHFLSHFSITISSAKFFVPFYAYSIFSLFHSLCLSLCICAIVIKMRSKKKKELPKQINYTFAEAKTWTVANEWLLTF